MLQMWREKASLGQIQPPMDMLRVPSYHHIDIRGGDAWEQTAIDVLVHGHAPSDIDEENIFSSRTAAAART